ncbi:MAG TPA: undecaprenyl-diphosphate phosphatase [Caulobacter sp.]|nr:undecaprenyl-diphosphate phosphatase [Caulobacter sp.]
MSDFLAALILGLVEGLTEFIPVSSTGHLLLTKMALGLTDPSWDSFIVLIQLGAILAVVALYFTRLWKVLIGLPFYPEDRRFALSVLIAFVPAVVLGFLLYDFIKQVLFGSPELICWSLIIGGLGLLALDRWSPAPRHQDAMKLPFLTSLGIGLIQCLSMVPGVSRSGATIVGGVLLGVDKRAAAEFSFFLAIPTMVGAFAKDAWESRESLLVGDHLPVLAVGFVVSFLSGLVVVKVLLDVVSKRGLSPFGWWRIAVGAIGLAWLQLT